MNPWHIDRIIENALQEDMPYGDVTTDLLFATPRLAVAELVAKEAGVLAGLDVAARVFALLDAAVMVEPLRADGDEVAPGDVLLRVEGDARALLKGERTALNLLQRLCGIATMSRAFCDAVADLPVRITDTRKTTPGLRQLEKYAVRMGGAYNHRFCLSDAIMLKDNHIAAAGGIGAAVAVVRQGMPHTMTIEVETKTLDEVREALDADVDVIMLDNMTLDEMRRAVQLIGGRSLVEASGGMRLDRVMDVAKTGVDIISVGALTHSVKSLDISMRFCEAS